MKDWKWWWTMPLLIAVGMLTPGVLGLTAAKADPDVDSAFIAAITNRGFTFLEPADAIGAAGEVCDYLNRGFNQYESSIMVSAVTGFDITTAAYFVGESVAAYCLEHTISAGQVHA